MQTIPDLAIPEGKPAFELSALVIDDLSIELDALFSPDA
jgi:hypothetical protein